MMTFLGTTVFYGSLTALGIKRKKKMIVLFFIGAYAFDMIQVFFASKFDDSSPLCTGWQKLLIHLCTVMSLARGKASASRISEEKYGY